MDSGDLFFERGTIHESRLAASIAKAGVIVDVFNAMGTAAINIGDRDLAGGVEKLKALEKRAKFPFLSANLQDAKTKKAIFKSHVTVDVKGAKLGFLGLISPASRLSKIAGGAEVSVGDPVAAAKAAVAALAKEKAEVIVLLSQLTEAETSAVLQAVPQIDLVLGSQNPKQQPYFGLTEGRLSAMSYMKGKNIGITLLHLQKGGKGLVSRGQAQSMLGEVNGIDRRIRSLERQWQRAAEGGSAQASRISYFQKSIDRLVKQREGIAETVAALPKVDPKAPFATYELVGMGRGLPEDEKITALVVAYNDKFPKPKPIRPQPTLKGTRAGGLTPIGARDLKAPPMKGKDPASLQLKRRMPKTPPKGAAAGAKK